MAPRDVPRIFFPGEGRGGLGRALRLAGDADVAAVNQARYLLTYLLYDGQYSHIWIGEQVSRTYSNPHPQPKPAYLFALVVVIWTSLHKISQPVPARKLNWRFMSSSAKPNARAMQWMRWCVR